MVKPRRTLVIVAAAVLLPGAAPASRRASYDPTLADQYQQPSRPDVVPADEQARRMLAANRAFEAVLYGTASVLQYRQMYQQAVDRDDRGFTGFNRFAHDRALAGPDYAIFKTPNADTLYSCAWLDLTAGPVILDVPPTGGRYFTVNLLDMFANASNISTRTHGNAGGRFLIATTDWRGEVPAGVRLFRVTTPHMWLLLRILVERKTDVAPANALQDRFRLEPLGREVEPLRYPSPGGETATDFLRVLDFLLVTDGHPRSEDALIAQFAAIGVGAGQFDPSAIDPATREGIEQGYQQARAAIAASLKQRTDGNSEWRFARDVGRYGTHYLLRSVLNTLGTGANVRDENGTFSAFSDANGAPLDGAANSYCLMLAPPPGRYFWSVTLYDLRTKALFPNPLGRYVIGDRTEGLQRTQTGAVPIVVRATPPSRAKTTNWLPAPKGPFYLVVRGQGPSADLVEGRWVPNPILPAARCPLERDTAR